MKRCPYCAEEIQDAAVYCKHCHRDLKASTQFEAIMQPTAAAPPTVRASLDAAYPASKSTKRTTNIVAIIGVGLIALLWYVWASSAYSVDLDAAKRVVSILQRDAKLSLRCEQREAEMELHYWVSMPTARLRDNAANSLARVCIDSGHGPSIDIYATSGTLLARFNGWTLDR